MCVIDFGIKKRKIIIKYPKNVLLQFQFNKILYIVQNCTAFSIEVIILKKRRKKEDDWEERSESKNKIKNFMIFPCFSVVISMQALRFNEPKPFSQQFSYLFGWKLWKKSKLSHDMSGNGTKKNTFFLIC